MWTAKKRSKNRGLARETPGERGAGADAGTVELDGDAEGVDDGRRSIEVDEGDGGG
ncbi:MAG: hypothetical protein HC882_05965 [Acidobacteria bacterium]|nr:hypothetical protein [Acidobacteriota bacterium]